MTDLIESLLEENKRLKKENSILYEKLCIAMEGLKALASDGNILGIPQKTLDEIESCNTDLPQIEDSNIEN